MSEETTVQISKKAFNTRPFLGYIKYMEKNKFEFDWNEVFKEIGISRSFVENQNNWLSFDQSAFLMLKLTNEFGVHFNYDVGRFSINESTLGSRMFGLMHVFTRPMMIYEHVPTLSTLVNNVNEFVLLRNTDSYVKFRYSLKSDNLSPEQQKLCYDFIEAGAANAAGWLAGVPKMCGRKEGTAKWHRDCNHKNTIIIEIFLTKNIFDLLWTHWIYQSVISLVLSLPVLFLINSLTYFSISVALFCIFRVITISSSQRDWTRIAESVEKSLKELQEKNLNLEASIQENQLLLKKNIELERRAAISEFSSLVIHDLRRPVSLVKNLVTLFESSSSLDLFFAHREQILQEINRAVGQAENISSDLMEYGSFAGVKPAPFRLRCFLERITKDIKKIENCDEVDFKWLFQDDIEVVADEAKMSRVFMNLFDNAIQVTKGRTTIEVTVSQTLTTTEICIKNSNSFVQRSDYERIFLPSFSERKGGTGLGLSIVKKVINAHEGSIVVYSEKGIYPTDNTVSFHISLPLFRLDFPNSLKD